MVTKQGDGTEKRAVPNTTGVTMQGDGGFDPGTGMYPMPAPGVEHVQETDNSSTGAITGYTDPKTYEAHLDNSSTHAVTGATEPRNYYQHPATEAKTPGPASDEAAPAVEPKATDSTPKKRGR